MTFQTESTIGTPAPATPDFSADISLELATRAHSGTSHSPERRGVAEVKEYVAILSADLAEFTALAEKHGTGDAFAELFSRYRNAFKRSTLAHLSAKSRCISTLITGGSNFPVRRAEKANATEHRRLEELLNCRKLWRKRILKAIVSNTGGPIMSGDADVVERLKEEIQQAETKQARMKEANAAIRKHKKAGPAAQVAALVALGFTETVAAKLLEPDACGRIGFADFQLTNNSANIRRMQARLVTVEKAHATPATEREGTNARIEDCPADNRVRLFYPGKPDADTRAALKSSGFRWTPSLGCWQAYRNNRTIPTARKLAGLDG
jgi:class 3 adenylate cyclase